MDHNEAIANGTVERYLLDELSSEARDQFEEHFFSCSECSLDLRAAASFIDQSKIVLSRPTLPKEVPATTNWGWVQWFRPAIAIPVMAMLLAIIGYQAANRPFGTAMAPRLLSSVSLLSANARGEAGASIRIPKGTPFVVYVDVPPSAGAKSFAADFVSPKGMLLWTLPLPADATKDTLTLEVPPVSGPSGTYTILIRAIDPRGESTELNRYSLTLDQP